MADRTQRGSCEILSPLSMPRMRDLGWMFFPSKQTTTTNKNHNNRQRHSESRDCLSSTTGVKPFGLSSPLHPEGGLCLRQVQPLCVEPPAVRGCRFLLCLPLRVLWRTLDPRPDFHSFCLRLSQQGFLSIPVSTRS